jgi:hypothetical protein
MSKVKHWRRLRMGLQTLLGLRRQGFFIPYRYADGVAPAQPLYAALAERFAAAEPVFLDLLRGAEDYADALLAIAQQRGLAPGSGSGPKFDQDWFPTLDAVAAYMLVRQYGPKRIVEVGSGHSTRFLARAVQDAALPTEITAIDPQPRAALTGLPVRFHNAIVQTADPAIFAALQPGDILFVDSSHILMPGTDVDWLFNRVLPALPHGVLVHIHDIFLPDDYPSDWAWRAYNEQQAIGPLLAGGFQPVFSSHYVQTRLAAAVQGGIVGCLPQAAGARPASLWLIRPA